MKGFKEFIMRGNIVDLAVAVVIGTAFAKVVDTFVSKIVTPILNSFGDAANSEGLGFSLKSGTPAEKAATFINFSDILNALIVFLLTAAVVYFVFVVPMKKLKERRGIVDAEDPTEVELLSEIRDELRARR